MNENLSSKYGQTDKVKPLTANRGLPFAVRWRNLDLVRSLKRKKGLHFGNRPSPISKEFPFQNEAQCKTFLVKMSFICTTIHINGFALSLALKLRLWTTWNGPYA